MLYRYNPATLYPYSHHDYFTIMYEKALHGQMMLETPSVMLEDADSAVLAELAKLDPEEIAMVAADAYEGSQYK